MSNPFDFINSINNKEYIWDDKFSDKDYLPFMVNNGLSYFADTVLYANELNKYGGIPVKCQYDFLFHSVTKKKRFSKWVKKELPTGDIEILMNYYSFSMEKAKEALLILTEDQLEIIRQTQNTGGRK